MSPNISPVRMVVINILVLTLLATLVGRLWYIQVLTGGEAQAVAERTSLRFVYEQAPRGFIFDREGRTVARNRTALTVALDVSRVPPDDRERLVGDLARALDMDRQEVQEIVDDPRIAQHVPRPIALDVDKDVVVALREQPERFPGVSHLEIPVREYPLQDVRAAHVLGHIGQIEPDELAERQEHAARAEEEGRAARTYRSGDLVGRLGVERVYEDWLAGREGVRQIAVNVQGQPVEESVGDPPQRGWDAILSIDAALQHAAENALAEGVEIARGLIDPDTGDPFEAPAGAVVALDPRNGEVLALASFPDFDPNLFVGSSDPNELRQLFAEESHQPFLNRAIAAAVPPGSTFKPFTAVAAWDIDNSVRERTWFCPGHFQLGNRVFRDWTPRGHGNVGLSRGLAESCDIVFYNMGVDLDAHDVGLGDQEPQHLQTIAREFGFGSLTEIDLRGEQEGLVGDQEWKWHRFSYAQTIDRRWFAGDNVNLSIGQGFLQVTPLQLASAYAAIANGGVLYRPRVLKCVAQLDVSRRVDPNQACAQGTVPRSAAPKILNRVPAPDGSLEFMEESMVGTQVGDGTAASAFSGFPFDQVYVSGKTGTAQSPQQPFSWYAAIARSGEKEMVVVAMVEEAGTGSQIAAPIARRVIERHFGIEESTFEVGARTD